MTPPKASFASTPSTSRRSSSWSARRTQAGVALIIALVMLSVILTVTGVLLRNTRQQDQLTGTNTAAARAQFAAELALRDAVQRLTAPATSAIAITNKPAVTSANALTWVFSRSVDATTLTTPADYKYQYTIQYRRLNPDDPNSPIALTERSQPVYSIKATGESGNARRRAELAIIDAYAPSPWGWGLIGCEGVWMAGNNHTRSLNSETTPYPLGSRGQLRRYGLWEPNGSILTLATNELRDGKKVKGNIELGSSSLIQGRTVAAGSIRIAGSTVNGTVMSTAATVQEWGPLPAGVTLAGSGTVNGDVYAYSVSGRAPKGTTTIVTDYNQFPGSIRADVEQQCDGFEAREGNPNPKTYPDGVTGLVAARNTAARGGTAFEGFPVATTSTPNSPGLTASVCPGLNVGCALRVENTTVTLGAEGQKTTYLFSSINIGRNGLLNIRGSVDIVVFPNSGEGNITMNDKTGAVTIATNSNVRVFTNGGVYLDAASFNYNDAAARPTSIIIYSSVVNPATTTGTGSSAVTTVPPNDAAKIQLSAPNTGLRALVYAPKALIWAKQNNHMYGSLRGRWIRFDQGSDFTFDQSSVNVDATILGYRVTYWAEQPYDNYTATY